MAMNPSSCADEGRTPIVEDNDGAPYPDDLVRALMPTCGGIGPTTFGHIAATLAAIPDGWAKVDGEWVQITSDGVGYGEFDRKEF